MGARIFEIGAGREGAALLVAGQNGDPDFGIGRHLLAMPGDLLVEVVAPGVARRGTAQGEPANMIAFFIEDRHRELPLTETAIGADLALLPRMIASTIRRVSQSTEVARVRQ